jgi:hypothetical protein
MVFGLVLGLSEWKRNRSGRVVSRRAPRAPWRQCVIRRQALSVGETLWARHVHDREQGKQLRLSCCLESVWSVGGAEPGRVASCLQARRSRLRSSDRRCRRTRRLSRGAVCRSSCPPFQASPPPLLPPVLVRLLPHAVRASLYIGGVWIRQ